MELPLLASPVWLWVVYLVYFAAHNRQSQSYCTETVLLRGAKNPIAFSRYHCQTFKVLHTEVRGVIFL